MTENLLLETALSYAKRGWHVFPLQGKIPLRGSKGFLNATLDETQISKWFSNGKYNIGIATGKVSGFFVLDVDNKAHKGKYGDEELKEIEKSHDNLPNTVESITTTGGRHMLFQYPKEGIGSCSDFRNGLDIRGDGGYIVAAGSFLDGKPYEWEVSSHPDDIAIANAPQWLLDVAKEKKKIATNTNGDNLIIEGSRNSTLTSLAGLFHSKGADKETILKYISTTNDSSCKPPLPYKDLQTIVNSIGKYEVQKFNLRNPLTDSWNAKTLHSLYGERLKYCNALKGWHLWNGKYWQCDDKYIMYKLCQEASRKALQEFNRIKDGLEEKPQKNIFGHILKMQSKGGIENMIDLLRAEPGIAKDSEEFDNNQWLLNCQNGTFNLKTDEFYQHKKEDLITKCLNLDYDSEAKCPEWDKFLMSIFMGDQDIIAFIQRAVGYSLSGNVSEDCIFMLYGMGSNGKSTFLKHILNLLGPYALTTPAETLLEKKGDAPLNDIARMKGHRFVSCAESGRSRYMDEARVKQMTGGDPIPARFLYKEYFEFYSTFKIFFATNNLPNVTELSNGIWRRLFAIPFNNEYLKEDIDVHLDEKLSKEYQGILNWGIKGFRDWQQNRLGNAQAIQDFTEHYREDSNIIQMFLNEKCSCNKEASTDSISATDLWKAFSEWNQGLRGKQYRRREFNDYLVHEGYDKKKKSADGGKYHFFGIVLVQAYQNSEEPPQNDFPNWR